MSAPFIRQSSAVTTIMTKVLVALLPALAVYVYLFGIGILIQLAVSSIGALAGEAAILRLRGRAVVAALSDMSALVTAWLLTLSLPPLVPWWLTLSATLFAVVVAKHLYGGLGQNPFNPAMVGFCAMIIAFPALLSQWPTNGLGALTQFEIILTGMPEPDAMTAATALDALRTGLHTNTSASVATLMDALPAFGYFGSTGWEWVSLAYLCGGLWLISQRVIGWQLPAAFLLGLGLVATPMHLIAPAHFPSPLFHLASGGTMLAAFFIITDPVSGATTPRGKLIFGAGTAAIAYIIRSFGTFPEGIAFAVLVMNLCVPLIDVHTQPAVFGHKPRRAPHP